MNFINNIDSLKEILKKPLPGEEVQYRLAPDTRLSKQDYLDKFTEHKQSCVLILIYPSRSGDLTTMMIKRPVGGAHGGQIAFPGGKVEHSDESLWHTAIRESYEEIGIDLNDVSKAAQLSSLFIPVSKLTVAEKYIIVYIGELLCMINITHLIIFFHMHTLMCFSQRDSHCRMSLP